MDPLEGDQGCGGRVEGVGDLPQMVLAVEIDALAAAEVGADRDGGVAVLGVSVDEELAMADVVIDLLGRVGDLADLAAGAPGHWIVGPGPFLGHGFPEPRGDLDADPVSGQLLGRLFGPVGLLVIDAGQDQGVLGHDGPVGGLQAHVGDVGLGAGQGSGHGTGVGGVDVEADVRVDGLGGGHVGVSSPVPVAIGWRERCGRPWWSGVPRGW